MSLHPDDRVTLARWAESLEHRTNEAVKESLQSRTLADATVAARNLLQVIKADSRSATTIPAVCELASDFAARCPRIILCLAAQATCRAVLQLDDERKAAEADP